MEATASTALLGALLGVQFLLGGVLWVNRCHSVASAGGCGSLIAYRRVGTLCVEGPNTPYCFDFPLRPSFHPKPIEDVR
jgi:hypothetical protein